MSNTTQLGIQLRVERLLNENENVISTNWHEYGTWIGEL